MTNYRHPEQKATETVTFRLTRQERHLLDYLARQEGQTLTDFVRSLLTKRAAELELKEIPEPTKRRRPGRPRKPQAHLAKTSGGKNHRPGKTEIESPISRAIQASQDLTITNSPSELIPEPAVVAQQNHIVVRQQHAAVESQDDAVAEPHSHAIVDARNDAVVEPHSHAIVDTRNDAVVEPHSHAIVDARNDAVVEPHSHAIVDARDDAVVELEIDENDELHIPVTIVPPEPPEMTLHDIINSFRKSFVHRADGTKKEFEDTIAFFCYPEDRPPLLDVHTPLSMLSEELLTQVRESMKPLSIRVAKKNLHLTYLRMMLHWAVKAPEIDLTTNPARAIPAFTITEVPESWPGKSFPTD